MFNFNLYFVIFIINIHLINAEISDKRYCVDEQCTVPISLAKTLIRYSSPDKKILSFGQNEEIVIYSKSAGKQTNLWGAEINGKRGYVPKHLVREYKVFVKATLLVDTEIIVGDNKSNDSGNVLQVPLENNENIVRPDKVHDPYEIVDGTTIYLNPQDSISPSSTENPIQPTVIPEIVKNTEQNTEDAEKLDEQSGTISTAQSDNQEKKENRVENDIDVEDGDDDNEDEDNSEDDNENNDDDDDEEEEIQKAETVLVENPNEDQVVEDRNDDKIDINEEILTEDREKPEITTFSAKLDENIKENLELITDRGVSNNNETLSLLNDVVETKLDNEIDITIDNIQEQITSLPKLETSPPSSETTKDTLLDNKIETTVDNENDEIVTATTILPELEIPPQPIESVIENITPNPIMLDIGENQIQSELISESPLGGLFDKKPEKDVIQSDQSEEQIKTDFNSNEGVDLSGNKPDLEIVQPIKIEEQINISFISNEEISNVSNEQQQSNQNGESIKNVENSEILQINQIEDAEIPRDNDDKREEIVDEQPGMLSNVLSFISGSSNDDVDDNKKEESKDDSLLNPAVIDATIETVTESGIIENVITTTKPVEEDNIELVKEEKIEETIVEDVVENSNDVFCSVDSCQNMEDHHESTVNSFELDWSKLNTNMLIYLATTSLSVIILIVGYVAIEKNRREGPLVAKINKLEKDYLIILKENELLKDDCENDNRKLILNDHINDELIEKNQQINELTNIKMNLEEQIQLLEKELENSTEVGLELNRMLSEILNSQSGSDVIKANIENLQRQLIEQQTTINSVNETLAITDTENHELKLEIELNNKKIFDLQSELDKMCLNILKIEEEKDAQQNLLENEIIKYRQLYDDINNQSKINEIELNRKIELLENQFKQIEHDYELKQKEFNILKHNVKLVNDNGTTLATLIETTEIQAELELLKVENQRLNIQFTQLQNDKNKYEKQTQTALEEIQRLQEKYDEADKLRVETHTKLEVLSNYFKDKEAQLQKEISKHESLWAEKQGEATSTTERIKFMQEQLQNYKAQNESLKQEIISQEVQLKSQISVLEKKAHENWVNVRQVERKLDDAKQECAQLRHRLTLSERALQEGKTQHRLQSPIEQNGDLTVTPSHIESPSSPPLLYGRDHVTKSPPLPPGLPPFLPPPPPPPGVPFMPPPSSAGLHGMPPPPFIPPPPALYPGDHRPPPLGRMSSPPLNSRYSPSSRGYSPYDRDNSSSPSDSEYGTSPPQHHHHHHHDHHRRGYSPFHDDRRDYKRPQTIRSNGRNIKGGSSGSGHSNESLDKINRQKSKV